MVRASLLADPRVQGLLDLVAVVMGEPAVLDQKILGFSQAPPPFCAGVVGVPGGEGHLMCGAQPGLVLLADLEVQVNGVAFLVAAVGDFAHGQTGRVHHVPFRVLRDFPAHHGENTSP